MGATPRAGKGARVPCLRPRIPVLPRHSACAERVIPLAAVALALATPGLADGQRFSAALRCNLKPKESPVKLITEEQRKQLIENGRQNAERIADDGKTIDLIPVVKLFCPWSAGTWLLTEIDPDEPSIAFGLCDLGMGSPEIGSVSLEEIEAVRGPGGLKIERDMYFKADKTLAAYADEAQRAGRIEA